jgi:hypothetical protein
VIVAAWLQFTGGFMYSCRWPAATAPMISHKMSTKDPM